MKILILNGPNLNFLGQRNPGLYGNATLVEVNNYIKNSLTKFGNFQLEFFQSNHEGELIDKIQQTNSSEFVGIVINAGGYSHSSIALMDALAACKKIKIEVHLSNILNREEFRSSSLISKSCDGSIIGLGADAYILACIGIKIKTHVE